MPRPVRPREQRQRRKSRGDKRDYDGQNAVQDRVKNDQRANDEAKRWAFMMSC